MSVNLALWAILIVVVIFLFVPPVVRDVRWRWARRRRRRARPVIELPLGKRRLP